MSLVPSFEEIWNEAIKLGWDDVGITSPTIPEEDVIAYEEWLKRGDHADLKYMENDLRCYPEKLFPGAKSAIIFISHYKQKKAPFTKDGSVVASYARGRDYHHLHRKRLKKMIAWLEMRTGMTSIAKGFSDSTPILEKALAVQAGLGWFGKNTLLIHRKFGTFTLLSGLLTSLELAFTGKSLRLPKCGSCQKCIDACPTQALTPYRLDANKCLSYHLIESKKQIPETIRNKNPGYAFGCDICQDSCPHNVRPPLSQTFEFAPASGIGPYITENMLEELKKNPEKLFGTPLQRRGINGLSHTLLLDNYP